jgi:hypothetical protein
MISAKDVLNTLTAAISTALGSTATVGVEFTGRKMELPVKNLHIATGIRNLSVSYSIDAEGNRRQSRALTVEALICAPKTAKGTAIAEVVDGILTAALSETTPPLVKFYTSRASYSTTLGAIIQSVFITVEF